MPHEGAVPFAWIRDQAVAANVKEVALALQSFAGSLGVANIDLSINEQKGDLSAVIDVTVKGRPANAYGLCRCLDGVSAFGALAGDKSECALGGIDDDLAVFLFRIIDE